MSKGLSEYYEEVLVHLPIEFLAKFTSGFMVRSLSASCTKEQCLKCIRNYLEPYEKFGIIWNLMKKKLMVAPRRNVWKNTGLLALGNILDVAF